MSQELTEPNNVFTKSQKKSKNAEMARWQIDKLKDKQVNDITRIFGIFNSNFPSTVIFSKTFILSSQNQ